MRVSYDHKKRHNNILIGQMASVSNESVGGGRESTFQMDLEDPQHRFKIPGVGWRYFKEMWRQLQIIRAAKVSVGKVGGSLGVW